MTSDQERLAVLRAVKRNATFFRSRGDITPLAALGFIEAHEVTYRTMRCKLTPAGVAELARLEQLEGQR